MGRISEDVRSGVGCEVAKVGDGVMSDYLIAVQEILEQANQQRCKPYRFDSRQEALLALDHLVLQGLDVLVSYTQGFWYLTVTL